MKTQQMTRLIKYCLHSLVVAILCITATTNAMADAIAARNSAIAVEKSIDQQDAADKGRARTAVPAKDFDQNDKYTN